MRTTIAHKKHSAGIMYIVLALFGLGMLVYAGINPHPSAVLGAVFLIAGGILSVQYLALPSDIIVLSGNNTLLLPKGVTIPLEAVNDVSYRRASAKGIQYRWGSLTLTTRMGTYKFAFVADCEDVSKHLTQLVYAAKHNNE